MFILDSNVISELMRDRPERRVARWVGARPASAMFTTTICMAEILFGVAILPRGKRQREIEAAAGDMFAGEFAGRILGFDHSAARRFASIAAECRRLGRPMAHADAQIAAIVASRGATLVTRNTSDFADTGIDLVDPWQR